MPRFRAKWSPAATGLTPRAERHQVFRKAAAAVLGDRHGVRAVRRARMDGPPVDGADRLSRRAGRCLHRPRACADSAPASAGCVLASSLLYALIGHINTLDMGLTFFLASAVFAFCSPSATKRGRCSAPLDVDGLGPARLRRAVEGPHRPRPARRRARAYTLCAARLRALEAAAPRLAASSSCSPSRRLGSSPSPQSTRSSRTSSSSTNISSVS